MHDLGFCGFASSQAALSGLQMPPDVPRTGIFCAFGRKKRQHAAGEPKRDARAKERRTANPSAQRTPDAQTLKGRPPTKVEPNCDALDKLSGPLAQRSITQAESRGEPLPAGAPWIDEERQGFPALIKTSHFSVGLPCLLFYDLGKCRFSTTAKKKIHRKVGRFYHAAHIVGRHHGRKQLNLDCTPQQSSTKNPRHARRLGFSNARIVDKRWGRFQAVSAPLRRFPQ